MSRVYKYNLKNIFELINETKWWILHRFWPPYRYHVHKFSRLKPGWHDVDNKILHACFDFLCDFIENEDGLKHLKYQYEYLYEIDQYTEGKPKWIYDNIDEKHKDYLEQRSRFVYDEALDLYNWWKNYDQYESVEDYGDLETENLIRLIKIRGYLWT